MDTPLSSVVLRPSARRELEEIVREWNHRAKLRDRGISPRCRLLFHGPPGCGKSLTARALATELRLPAYLVRFDAVIGAYLGQTAIHLRQLFQFAEVTPCVLLLDELDALGKRRGNPLDVGELDRIVIALMQELEHSAPAGLIIGTSNLAKYLDDALWRRFDLALEFPSPRQAALKKYVKQVAMARNVSLPVAILRLATRARSFADAEAIVVAEARRQAIRNH
jgi:SpoVK/Ycf46/Vps4 family AAA+-type ATPase